MKIFEKILQFIEQHKTFVKKIILFSVLYIIMFVLNQPQVLALFNQIFGENITLAISPLCASFMLGGD